MKELAYALIIALICLIFTGCMGQMGISVTKLDYTPEDYYNITSDQLDEYPPLKYALNEIINSGEDHSFISCNNKQMDDIKNLFGGEFGEKFFRCNEQFYRLNFLS